MDIVKISKHNKIPLSHFSVGTLEGKLKKHSTEELHFHESHQILFFNSGISLLFDEQKQQPLFNRMMAFIPAGCPHRSVVLGREVEYKSLYLEKGLFPVSPKNIRVFDMGGLGISLFKEIEFPLFKKPKESGLDLSQDCLQLFLKILNRDISRTSPVARLPIAKLFHNKIIVKYIEQRYREKIALQDFANLLPYTTRHISRMFKEELKISIFEYLKIYRVMQASILLETKETTVMEIAYECGYNSISCFFKDFGQLFSITPKQFRNRVL